MVKGVLLNELCAANASGVMGDYLNTNCVEWVEIINTTDSTVDLAGYCLTDSSSNPGKWPILAGNYLDPGESVIFWADKLNTYDHMNFKLKMTGGSLALYSPSLELLDSITYPAQVTDVSYGRGPNGGTVWYYLATPTPGAANSGAKASASTRASAPVFSVAPGFKASAVSVSMSADPGASISYTTDGSIPTSSSASYSGPVPISASTVLKARAFTGSSMPSLVTVGTYFIGESTGLPVVSVSTNPAYLTGDAYGIYAMGLNPLLDPNPPYYNANFWQDWERPVHVELFEADGTRGLCAFGGVKINGNTTVGVPEKSLAFYAKEKYGLTTFTYALFPEDKPTISDFPRFLVRNSGQDWPRALFRDAFSARVIKGQMDLDYQAYRPVLHFLNGAYNGVINLREKADQYFAVSNHGATAGAIDFLEYEGATVLEDDGSDQGYTELIDYITANDITGADTYAHVQTLMDVDEFINYVIAETFCGNVDWPASNVKFWRSQAAGSRWRWILQDTDYAWGYRSDIHLDYGPSRDPFLALLDPVGSTWPNPPEGTYLFRRLILNATFRAAFRARYLAHLSTTFEQSRLLGILNGMVGTLEPEMGRQTAKWGGQLCGLVGNSYLYPATSDEWQGHVIQVRDYVSARTAHVLAHVNYHFPDGGGLVTGHE